MSTETQMMVNILDSLADVTAIGMRGKTLLNAVKSVTPIGTLSTGDKFQEQTLKLLEAHAKIMPQVTRHDLHQTFDKLEDKREEINEEDGFFKLWGSRKKIDIYTNGARRLNKKTKISSKQARSDKLRKTTGIAQRASSTAMVHGELPESNTNSGSQSIPELNPFADTGVELCVLDGQSEAEMETHELDDASSHGLVVLPEVGQAM